MKKELQLTKKATRKIEQKLQELQQERDNQKQIRLIRAQTNQSPTTGIRLMGCVDLPTIKEAFVQNNRFKANSEHKIQYLLMQDVELRQLGNVLIIQPRGTAEPGDRHVPVSQLPIAHLEPIGLPLPIRTSKRAKALVDIAKNLAECQCGRGCATANCDCLPCKARTALGR